MADSQSPLGACAVERDIKVGPQAFAKATVLHRERMGECPSSKANRTRSQRHGRHPPATGILSAQDICCPAFGGNQAAGLPYFLVVLASPQKFREGATPDRGLILLQKPGYRVRVHR